MYLGTRKCPHCQVRRVMVWDEEAEAIRCGACQREVYPRAGQLTEDEKARLASCAVRYQQANGFRLSPTRDLGKLRG